ncbi:MAG: restriction endonuclease subunit S [Planctomycetaceae bacterium]|nr:restriction endonuclease subunit S [Planctomycetaceae bacterium]
MSSKKKTPTKKEDAPAALVPKLRFPEFRQDDPWTDLPIDSILAVRDERRVPTAETPLYSLTIENGVTEKTDRYNREFLVRDAGNKKYKLVEPNDIVYNPSNLRWGAINYSQLRREVVVSPIYEVLYLRDDSQYFLQFVACAVMREEQIARFITKAQGTLVERIAVKIEDFVTTRLPVPAALAEQQKIASCLSSLDELIVLQGRKMDALKTHKKGLMQRLFPLEGETQPRLRFPEFKNAGEWEEVALGDIAEIKLGKMLDKQKHTSGRLLPYLNNLSVRWNEVKTTDLPQMYFDDHEIDRFGLKAGDVVVCEGGEPGRAAVWDGRLPNLKFQKAIHRVRFNVKYEPKLLVFHLENLAGTPQFEMLFTGGGIKHLTRETFARLKVPIIPHAEQHRIATCLSSLDALITAETQKLEALKTHKRSLLQQLFPSQEKYR